MRGDFVFKFLKRKPKNEDSPAFRLEMAKKLDGKHIRYVVERVDNEDNIIGRAGGLNIKDDEFLVFSSGIVIFRAKIIDLKASELMSGNGVILTAHDLENEGKLRSVIAHYTYYNK